jgi:hypothetical protein
MQRSSNERFSHFLQKKMNKYGKYMEITKFGRGGRRGFIVILEGCEGQGWRHCISQMGWLLKHLNHVRDANAEKIVTLAPTRAVVPGRMFADVVEGKQPLGQTSGVHKVKPLAEVQSGRSLNTMAGEGNKATGEGTSKLAMEGVQFTEIMPEDHAMQQMKILEPHSKEDFTRGLKEILISFQKEIASCLYKLEMGWENEEGPGHFQPNQMMDLVDHVDLKSVKGGTTSQVDLEVLNPVMCWNQ